MVVECVLGGVLVGWELALGKSCVGVGVGLRGRLRVVCWVGVVGMGGDVGENAGAGLGGSMGVLGRLLLGVEERESGVGMLSEIC